MAEEEKPKELWPRNSIITDEAYIPTGPRFFWLDARRSYESDLHIGSILLASLAAELGLRDYLENWLSRKFGESLKEFLRSYVLESLDYRRLIELCKSQGLLKSILGELHGIYDVRKKYAHAKILEIIGELRDEEVEDRHGENVVRRYKVRDDDFLRSAMAYFKATQDSWTILQRTEKVLKVIYMESGYWRNKLGEP